MKIKDACMIINWSVVKRRSVIALCNLINNGLLSSKDQARQKFDNEERLPDYDAETKALIEVADAARNKFREVDDKLRTIDDETK